MADISKICVSGSEYNIKDSWSRDCINSGTVNNATCLNGLTFDGAYTCFRDNLNATCFGGLTFDNAYTCFRADLGGFESTDYLTGTCVTSQNYLCFGSNCIWIG